MLVGGSPANAMLASLFTTEQQPSLVFPLTIEPTHDPALDAGGHRRAPGGAAQGRPGGAWERPEVARAGA